MAETTPKQRLGFWRIFFDFKETSKPAAGIAAVVFLGAAQAFCQTTLNLQTQSRNADFSNFPFTRPVTVGVALPATCQVGQLFFNSAAVSGSNLYACTTNNVWTLESVTNGASFNWSAIIPPSANLLVSMGSYTSLFTFGSATGSNDLFKWTDSTNNSGTGAIGHFTSAPGSSVIPWQADANGTGWRVNTSGQLQGIGSSNAAVLAFPQGNAPASFPVNSFSFYAPATIGTSYQWVFPSADAAGAVVSDGNGTPGHLSILGFSGTGNIAKTTAPTLTSPALTAPNINGAANWLFTVSGGGVTANKLCKTDSNFNIVAIGTADSAAYGVCPATAGSGTTNYAVARYGQQTVLADGSTTIGDLAVISTTNAGYVHDSGQTSITSIPMNQRIIGAFKTAATASGQTAIIDLTPGLFGTQVPAFTGDTTTSVGSTTTITAKINGTSVPTNSASDQTIVTTAAATGSWTSLPNCQDSNGSHLNYNTSSHAFSCGSTSSGGTGSSTWSGLAAPAGNLSLSMGAETSLFTFGASTGSNDLFKWTDSASNSGTGALGHFATASGSTAIPWQADANGVGWKINSSGQLQGIGSSSAGMIAFPQGSAPTSFPANSFGFYAPASIGTSYQWVFPSADAAGAIVSDGNGTPGHLSIIGFSGTGNIARAVSPTFTGTTTVSALNVTGGCTGCGTTSLGIQEGGSAQGAASTLNCSTNVTCSVNGGVATITASSTAATSFGALTSATNTQAAMIVGSGASVIPSGTGIVQATAVVDTNQNPALLAGASSSAVDEVTITNAATGGTVDIAATGTDANIPLTIQGKGSGQLNLNSANAHVDDAGNLTVASCTGCGSTGSGNKSTFAGGLGGALAASTTQYGPPNGMMKNSTESTIQQPNPATGTLNQLLVCISSAQPSSGTLVVTLRKAAVSTSLAVTIAANAAAGCYSDPSDTVASNQGDLLGLQVVNNATVASGNIAWSLLEQ